MDPFSISLVFSFAGAVGGSFYAGMQFADYCAVQKAKDNYARATVATQPAPGLVQDTRTPEEIAFAAYKAKKEAAFWARVKAEGAARDAEDFEAFKAGALR